MALGRPPAQLSFPSLFCTMEPEPVQPGMLIDVCKYLDSLQYRVWRKMVMSVESGEWGCGVVEVGVVTGGGSTSDEAVAQLSLCLPASRPF